MFRTTASSAALAAIPPCRESGSVHVSSMYWGKYEDLAQSGSRRHRKYFPSGLRHTSHTTNTLFSECRNFESWTSRREVTGGSCRTKSIHMLKLVRKLHKERLFSNYQLNAHFLYSITIYMLHYNPQHVSSSTLLIIRRKNCIITASGIVTLCKRPYRSTNGQDTIIWRRLISMSDT